MSGGGRCGRGRTAAAIGVLVIGVAAAFPRDADAVDLPLPPVNLGDTNFQDGIAFPGWLVEQSFGYYRARDFKDSNGNDIPGSNRLTAYTSLTHVAWLCECKLLGGFYGAEVLLPAAHLDFDTTFGPDDRESGVGDLIVSPFILQWSESSLFGRPYFHRLNMVFIFPTGEYDEDSPVNTGSNVFSFNPYYAFTLVATERFELSSRLHYLWNSENRDPFVALGASDAQPGQAFHGNFAASYEVLSSLRIGVASYALLQITRDEIDGDGQTRSKERVFALGPGVKYTYRNVSMYLNSYFETQVKNRPIGTRVVARLALVF
jgi:hypothetical protein